MTNEYKNRTQAMKQRTPLQLYRRARRNALQEHFLASLNLVGVKEVPALEYRFDSIRRWRFDACWPNKKVAVEIEGGTWIGGGHVRGKRYEEDCRKRNAAQEQGWRVYCYTTDMVKSLEAAWQIRGVLNGGKGEQTNK